MTPRENRCETATATPESWRPWRAWRPWRLFYTEEGSGFDVGLDEEPADLGAAVVDGLLELVDGARHFVAREGAGDAHLGGEHDFARALLERDEREDLGDGAPRLDEAPHGLLDLLVGALAEQERLDLDGEEDRHQDENH